MELEYMDNTKNDHYYLDKIKTDLAFIVAHMKDVDGEAKRSMRENGSRIFSIRLLM